VTSFRKQVGVPAIAAATVAAALMAIDGSFRPPPLVLPFKYGAVVVHVPWLLTLFLIGAGATFLARRAGGFSRRVLVALSPALLIGGAVNLLMAFVVTSASISGQRVHPIDFVGHFIVGWLAVPAFALLIGSLPFLRG
jgi:hypothetical protein